MPRPIHHRAHRRRRPRGRSPITAAPLLAAAGVCLSIALSGCSSADGSSTTRAASTGNPLAGQSFYVDPRNIATRQAALWHSEGHPEAAATLERIGRQPIAKWFGESASVRSEVQAVTEKAAAAGKSALLVAYDIPDRDCGSYSSGGAASGAIYRLWLEHFAAGIGDRTATVILEPDALPEALSHCLSASVRNERYALLRFAVHTLKSLPHVSVFIDAGNNGWINPVKRLVVPLLSAGVEQADGFSLNVSNFFTTASSIAYGTKLSALLHGKHFVIDTSRNGRGPDASAAANPTWCNPPGRALGEDPTTETGNPLVDAFLWIKQPGQSDGSCRPGEPRAGQWWPEYALELAGGESTTSTEE